MHDFTNASPRLGRSVLYMLTDADCREIVNQRRAAGSATARGNEPREGAIYPGVIVEAFGGTEQSTVNLQVFLDGVDAYWPTSRSLFDPETHGTFRYFVQDDNGDDALELTHEKYQSLSASTGVRKQFEPDARGHFIYTEMRLVSHDTYITNH